MKNNKTSDPDNISTEFYKAMFYGMDLEEKYPSSTKCLEILLNKVSYLNIYL